MPQYESADIQAQQKQESRLEALKSHEIKENKALIKAAIQEIESQWLERFARKNLTEDDVKNLKKEYADLLQKLKFLEGEIDVHNQALIGNENLSVQMVKLEGQEIPEELHTEIEAKREAMKKIIGDADVAFNDIDEGIQKLAFAEYNEKEVNEVFKQPIYSVKNIFEEEVERNLLMGADARMALDANITKLKAEANRIKTIYYKHSHYLRDSDDWHDDQRFLGRIEKLLNSNWPDQSLDVANFLIDSRKFISSLKRRIKFEETEGNTNKVKLIELLRKEPFDHTDESMPDDITDENLAKEAERTLKNYSIEKADERIQDLMQEKRNRQGKVDALKKLQKEKEDVDEKIRVASQGNSAYRSYNPQLSKLTALDNKITTLTVEIRKDTVIQKEIESEQKQRNALSQAERLLGDLNAATGITDDPDIAQLNDSYDDINDIVSEIKIDGDKGLLDTKQDLVSKYSELEAKQKNLVQRSTENSFTSEESTAMEQEIQTLRVGLKDSMLQKWLGNVDAEIMTKIQRQEGLISDFLDWLYVDPEIQPLLAAVQVDDPPIEAIRKFQNHPKVERLRQLHQQFGAFQNTEQEQKYIEFMYAWNKNMQEDRKHVAEFHSLNQSRILQNSFGNWEEDFSNHWRVRMTRGVLDTMGKLKNKDATGFPGVLRSTLNGLGSLGYGASKVAAHYPAKLTGIATGNALAWMQAKSINPNWLLRTSSNLAKLPINLASKPAYLFLKPAETILTWFANTVGGDLSTGTVSRGHLDNFIAAKVRNIWGNEVTDLFDAVFELSTHGVGIPCEFTDKQFLSTEAKRKYLARWLKWQRPSTAKRRLRKLAQSSQARSFWHGQY